MSNQWPHREPSDRAYETDAAFRKLVDTLERYIHLHFFSPAEVRQAGVLACIHFEMRRNVGTTVLYKRDAGGNIIGFETPLPEKK